ncbi:MFS transporter [Asanoa sp. WMMD1127]|uniref:MFS transporter n=1 Tax=Asanoa sp. WMMD1127 TaxID=3016107 RepID=UPI002415CA80|nr:MFS transporter [Asanoa sp. WMMD1127]MDG4824817.1 MFS transporter [Asanoa sp. WMMD1127]
MRGALADLRPLRDHPTFRRLWLGSTLSGFGGQFGGFAVVFYVWDRTHNPALVGLLGLVSAVPLVTVALLGSAFVDHVDRRRLASGATWGLLATSLLMAVTAATASPVGVMLALSAVHSALAALAYPALRAFTPVLLPPERLAAGLALNHLSFQLAMLLGPAAAGLLTALSGPTACFVVDAVSFGAALAGIAGLPRVTGTPGGGAGLRAVADGIRFAVRTRPVAGALLADLCATLLAMPVALFPVVNQERFNGSPASLGLFLTAIGVGGAIASVLSGLSTRRRRPGVVLLACGGIWGLALGAAGLVGSLPAVLACLAVAGAADTWAVVARGTVVQSSTPDGYLGRVAALEHVVGVAGPELGNLRAGLVASVTTGGAAMAIGGLTCVVGTSLLAVFIRPLRTATAPTPATTAQPAP